MAIMTDGVMMQCYGDGIDNECIHEFKVYDNEDEGKGYFETNDRKAHVPQTTIL